MEIMTVYLVYNKKSGLYKVGVTKDIIRREKQLSNACGSSVDIVAWCHTDCALELEALILKVNSDSRHYGEWFEIDGMTKYHYITHLLESHARYYQRKYPGSYTAEALGAYYEDVFFLNKKRDAEVAV